MYVALKTCPLEIYIVLVLGYNYKSAACNIKKKCRRHYTLSRSASRPEQNKNKMETVKSGDGARTTPVASANRRKISYWLHLTALIEKLPSPRPPPPPIPSSPPPPHPQFSGAALALRSHSVGPRSLLSLPCHSETSGCVNSRQIVQSWVRSVTKISHCASLCSIQQLS